MRTVRTPRVVFAGLVILSAACVTPPPDVAPDGGDGQPDASRDAASPNSGTTDVGRDAGLDAADMTPCIDPGPHVAPLILSPTNTPATQVTALPVPVLIEEDASLAAILDEGETVWFSDPMTEAVLAHEIVAIDRAAGTVEAWVEWPNFVTTDGGEILLHVGDSQFRGVSPQMWSDYAGVWHFTPTSSGQRFQDSSANSNDGSAPNGATLAAGAIGSSGVFDPNANQHVSIDDSASLRVNEFTISAWVKFDSLSNQAVVQKVYLDNNQAVRRSYGLEVFSAGELVGFATPEGSNTYNTFRNPEQSPLVQSGQWHHVAYTRNGSGDGIWLYLDGVPVHSQAFNGPIWFDGGPLLLAAGQNNNGIRGNLDGQLDEVQISSKWRPPEWVAASHAVQAGGLLQLGAFGSESGACE